MIDLTPSDTDKSPKSPVFWNIGVAIVAQLPRRGSENAQGLIGSANIRTNLPPTPHTISTTFDQGEKMLWKLGRVLFTRWLLIALTLGVFGVCTTGCFCGHEGGWHHHDRW